MSLFISEAMAATTTAAGGAPAGMQGDGGFSIVILLAIFALFYLMLIRPQNKRAKEHRNLIGQLKAGDEIVTSGGILAKVNSLSEQYIKAQLTDGIEVSLQRSAVSAVLPKGTLKSL